MGTRISVPGRREETDAKFGVAAPSLTLPKGGGAIRGIGEKFGANPVTGSASMSVPIAASAGRSGFGPQMSLSYDSASGNGPFGFGWSVALPAITRKTDKGLPRYLDEEDSDVFILSGAEDLVPMLKQNADGSWARDADGEFEIRERPRGDFVVSRYRPRIEGLFARIERWTNRTTRDVHWCSISKDNVTTLYGADGHSRIADPEDPRRIFSWLICQSYDDKGNAVVYEYVGEDSEDVDTTQAHERNRTRTANRYLKYIKYGNTPSRFLEPNLANFTWHFEVVFDYGEHHLNDPTPARAEKWKCRKDPFSSYRAGFEIRTYRLCRRVLMFHRFEELGIEPQLVRSTDLAYHQIPDPAGDHQRNGLIASFLSSVTQVGYQPAVGPRALPPVEFVYSQAEIDETVCEPDQETLENLPFGIDSGAYQWIDLDGEGLSGVLTQQADGWFYKRNLGGGRLASVEVVMSKPSLTNAGSYQFLDLAGDGQLDVASFAPSSPGFFERTQADGWEPFAAFQSLPNLSWTDPNLRLLDLTGDGHADVLVTENEVFTWHPSLAEGGFGSAERVVKALDEEEGPNLVFADETQSIFLADLSGDGLTDLVRIRNGEVCYWPNLGYGRFGRKVTMDNAPWFDAPDRFDPRRIRIADIDGSGPSDIIYLGSNTITIYYNQSGNSWSGPRALKTFPNVDNLASVQVFDMLGEGTACLVWSSPLSKDARKPMRYVDLMAGRKPHLLVATRNNLGAETEVEYAPSTKFYLADKEAGKPWITRLPFPVHVVERVTTYDRISGNRFVSRYAYHHGFFDGVEREFRGFGMVEETDTENIGVAPEDAIPTEATNREKWSFVPPVLTRTWFHTGVYLGRDRISNYFAGLIDEGDRGEYFREPELLDDSQARLLLLDDTVLPPDLTVEGEREACRALKGSMLRQEVYALDGTAKAGFPYFVTEQNFTVREVQPAAGKRPAVFFVHPRETLSYHYERDPDDPRIQHAITLEVDPFGNVLKSVQIGYGRRREDGSLPTREDRTKQTSTLITYTENDVTNDIDIDGVLGTEDAYRIPLPWDTRTYELTDYPIRPSRSRFDADDFVELVDGQLRLKFASEVLFENAATTGRQRRLIERVRTMFRKNNLTGSLGRGIVESLALPFESYKLAFTPGLIAKVYKRGTENLLPDLAQVLPVAGAATTQRDPNADRGGYVDLDRDGHWWIPSGQIFYAVDPDPAREVTFAREHFFLPHRYRDPFGAITLVKYDAHKLFATRTQDALDNAVTASYDYRVLQADRITDPNGNVTVARFDALGLVVATAVQGKPGDQQGDSLDNFTAGDANPTLARLQAFIRQPRSEASGLLKDASTRAVYDLDRFRRCGQPPFAATLARESHVSDGVPAGELRIQLSFTYSDGFGRELQTKAQAEYGRAAQRQSNALLPSGDVRPGELVRVGGRPQLADTPSRWVGKGRTIYNNKGKPVKQYEPFFSSTHLYEEERELTDTGVTPVIFYDALDRVVATLHPNHTYDKVLFDPWQQATWDVNDTVTLDPRTDPDISVVVSRYFTQVAPLPADWKTWLRQRGIDPAAPPADVPTLPPDTKSAFRTLGHATTPTIAYFDNLGRTFLTVVDNGQDASGNPQQYSTRVELDIEGNQREVLDAKVDSAPRGRIVMQYDCDMCGNRIRQRSMEAGERWTLPDVAGNPIRAWDSRGHTFRTRHDLLRRPIESFVLGLDDNGARPILFERTIYGESETNPEGRNLRGRVYQVYDGAGIVTSLEYDFKGNLLRGARTLTVAYHEAPDWSADPQPAVENEIFESRTRYDALNRPIQVVGPRSNLPGHKYNVLQPIYNDAGLLERIDGWLQRGSVPGTTLLDPTTTDFHPVKNIDYNEKGQRTLIQYSNGVETRYRYDRETFRLVHLYTRRGATFTRDCENPQPPPLTIAAPSEPPVEKPCGVQNLRYTYDPVGNITHIQDDAQQTIHFNGQVVHPSNDYVYDAIYRLVAADGREHIGQLTAPETTWDDSPRTNQPHPNDGQLMRRYCEQYEYDPVGNIRSLTHHSGNLPGAGQSFGQTLWRREYVYEERSQREPDTQLSNRLTRTSIGAAIERYSPNQDGYDPHGNMLMTPHLPLMRWNFSDQLSATAKQVRVGGMPETTYYIYDGSGERVRKVTDDQAAAGTMPRRRSERIYLGGFEIYREYTSNGSIDLERQSLHVMDDKQRVALVETKTVHDRARLTTPTGLQRYQFGNHLGSAALELKEDGTVVSYEEYHPYGSTACQVVQSGIEAPAKRYRYLAMERDEESGFGYHGARYYAPWLTRWLSPDPIYLSSPVAAWIPHLSSYSYSRSNPTVLADDNGLADNRTQASLAAENVHIVGPQTKSHFGLDYSEIQVEPNVAEYVLTGKLGANLPPPKPAPQEATIEANDQSIEETPVQVERFKAEWEYTQYLMQEYGHAGDLARLFDSPRNRQPPAEVVEAPTAPSETFVREGSVPRIRAGEIKPNNQKQIREGINQLQLHEIVNPETRLHNVALLTYDVYTGVVHMRVLGPGYLTPYGSETESMLPRQVIWEGRIGRILLPENLAPQALGNYAEPPIVRLAAAATGQRFLDKSASATGVDLQPDRGPRVRINLFRRPVRQPGNNGGPRPARRK